MELVRIVVWNFLLLECIVRIDVYTAGVQWNFMIPWKCNQQNVAEPEEIMTKLMAERKKLIMGHYGDPNQDKKKLDESLLPNHYAISLSGEPTMYPKLPELIKYLKSLEATKSIFLVTNGQEPEMIHKLADEDALPTQLYLSTNAADYRIFFENQQTYVTMILGKDGIEH